VQINNVVCSVRTEAKLESKHHVTVREARQIFFSKPRIRFVESGSTAGDDVYGFWPDARLRRRCRNLRSVVICR
jgi:hypothetical protein